MSTVVIIKDDVITVPTVVNRPNLMPTNISLTQLITPYGLLIPLSWLYMSVLDWLDGSMRSKDVEGCNPALLVTPSGKLYEFILHGASPAIEENMLMARMFIRRIPCGEGVRYTRSSQVESEEIACMALHLTDDIDKAMDLSGRVDKRLNTRYLKMSIPEIVKVLHEAGITEDKPWNKDPK